MSTSCKQMCSKHDLQFVAVANIGPFKGVTKGYIRQLSVKVSHGTLSSTPPRNGIAVCLPPPHQIAVRRIPSYWDERLWVPFIPTCWIPTPSCEELKLVENPRSVWSAKASKANPVSLYKLRQCVSPTKIEAITQHSLNRLMHTHSTLI